MNQDNVYYGTVKWFSNAKGYGFIEPDNSTKDIFIHWSNIDMDGYKTLHSGSRVSFTTIDGEKGPNAATVVIIEQDEQDNAEEI